MNQDKEVPGTLMRGQDGNLYFVPQAKIAPYAVPAKGASQMEAKLPKGTVAMHTTVPAEWMNVGLCLIHHQE
jgi:hypothetical protein